MPFFSFLRPPPFPFLPPKKKGAISHVHDINFTDEREKMGPSVAEFVVIGFERLTIILSCKIKLANLR